MEKKKGKCEVKSRKLKPNFFDTGKREIKLSPTQPSADIDFQRPCLSKSPSGTPALAAAEAPPALKECVSKGEISATSP